MGITVGTTSYGHEALDRLADVVARHKRDDPMRQVTIVAPSNLAGIAARRRLARGTGSRGGIAGIDVTTLPRLAERLAAPTLAPRRPTPRPVVEAAWREQLRSAPGVFRDVADHPATIAALARAYTELREVGAAGLSAIGGASVLTADLVRLNEQVRDRLRDRWYDTVDLLDAASHAVAATGDGRGAATALGPVVLHLPQRLTSSECRFVAALAEHGEVEVVAGLTGAVRADSAVRASLGRFGADVPADPRPIATASRVLNASDSDDEVRCVVREVVATLRTTPAARVAVLYTATSPYARLLHEHLAEAGIAVNGPGARPVEERGVARALLEVLRLADSDLARADLFRAVAAAPTRDFTGERIPVARWERISRAAQVMRGDDWEQRLSTYAEDERARAAEVADDPETAARAARHEDAARAAEQLRAFAVRLRGELEAATRTSGWDVLGRWCLELFTTLVGEPDELRTLPPDEQYAAATVVSTLRGLSTLSEVEGPASLTTLRDALEAELSSTLPRVGRFGEGVLVAPVSAAVGLDLDITFVLGLSEDLYPGGLREDALLPARVRALVPDELTSSRDRLYEKFRHLLVALAGSPVVVASFPRGDLRRSAQRIPSRWLLGTLRRLSGDDDLAATRWDDTSYAKDRFATSGSFAGELLGTPRPATEQEWRARAAAAGALSDDVVDAAHRMLAARAGSALTRFDGNLSGVHGLPDFAHDDTAVSPTSLEAYAECPRAYFVGRLLGVQPLEQPEDTFVMSPAEIGTLVHACMDQLVREFRDRLPGPGEPWDDAQRHRLLEIGEEQMAAAQARGLTGHPRLWEPERARILGDLVRMLDDDNRWRAERGARVEASELRFGLGGADDRPAVEVAIGGGRVRMRGSADKIDVSADGHLYVTDIKTGSRRGFNDISKDPLVRGTKLQLPVYAYAARAATGRPDAPVTAGYWFVRRERGRISLELAPELEQEYARTLEVLVRSIAAGLFPGIAPQAPDFAWVQCPWCNPDGIGHGEQRERWERQRSDPALRELVALVDPQALVDADAEGGA